MEAIEFTTQIKNGNSIQIPAIHSNTFSENEHIRVIVLKEDMDDKRWTNIAVNALFKEDNEADDIYEKLRKK